MPIQAYYRQPDGIIQKELKEEAIKAAFESKEGLLWVDVYSTDDSDIELLRRVFQFHSLALEDCLSSQIHPPKIDAFEDHLFIVVHGINHAVASNIVETAELGIFLGENYVVSNHSGALFSVELVKKLVEEQGRPLLKNADFLAHILIDALIDNIMPTIDVMGERADEIEEDTIRNPRQIVLDAIMLLKRSALRIHRVIAPQREVVNRLSRGEFELISEEARIYYRDVYDHIVRIEDLNQMIRDRADNALSTYLSSVANRQNETMRLLSIVAAIFLPLTLLAGIYGMNFEYMPELSWRWGYFTVLGVMVIAILGIIGWFWAKRWFGWGRRRMVRVRPFVVDRKKVKGYFEYIARSSRRVKKS